MEQIEKALQAIKDQGLFREFKWLEAPQEPITVIDGKRVILLSSNSYLGLCNDARLKQAVCHSVAKYGVGAGGSRLTSGSYLLHRRLELELARFKRAEACMVFNTGYVANVGTIAGLAGRAWALFCDRLNHASIIDGCRLSGAKLVVYRHCDPEDLRRKMLRYGGKYNLIITDGVFSMDGDIAPLPELMEIARQYNSLLMVDDAHATGVIGPNGGGTADYFNIKTGIDLQMGTLSKALAGEGGYVAGSQDMIEYLRHRARSFVYSTAPAPHTMAVALEALAIVRNSPGLRKILQDNASWFRRRLAEAGFKVMPGITPIIPVLIGPAETAVRMSNRLIEAGIYIPAIRPPTVPKGTSRLRISLMASHSREVLQEALEKLTMVGREFHLTGGGV